MAYDYLNGADWSIAGNWQSAAVPVTGDSVSIGDGAPTLVVNAGLDNGGVDLASILIPRWFAGSVGSAASPLIAAASLLQVFCQGSFHFDCSTGGTGLKTDDVRIHTLQQNLRDSVVTLGSETGQAGDYDRITITRGNVAMRATSQFGASCILATGPARDGDVSLSIAAGADTLPTLHMGGGIVTAGNAITTAVQRSGTLYKTSAPITTLYLMGGTCYWTDPSVSGDGITIIIYPGATLDMRNTSQEINVSTIWQYPGAEWLRYSSIHTATTHYDLPEAA